MNKPKFILCFAGLVMCLNLFSQDFKTITKKINDTINNKYACSVIISKGDGFIYETYLGFADSAKTKKTSSTTIYNIASVTKSFTAIGILKLYEKGKIKLNDSIGKFINNVPPDKKGITIHHLLSHTSGFGQNYVGSGIGNRDSAIARYMHDKLDTATGVKFIYSNQNFELLAAILEIVSGMKYEEYIRKKIITPLKMKNTCFWEEAGSGKYGVVAAPVLNVKRNWDYIGSGGIYSCPADLYKLLLAFKSNKLLKPATTQLMLKTKISLSSVNVGYGCFNSTDYGTPENWFRGSESWGHNAVVRWFPEKKLAVIVCTNSGEIGNKQVTGNRLISNVILHELLKTAEK